MRQFLRISDYEDQTDLRYGLLSNLGRNVRINTQSRAAAIKVIKSLKAGQSPGLWTTS
jgi:hypothetical protein